MTAPILLFAFMIASLFGALYHLVRNGGPGRLFLYLALGWAGFAAGHLVGVWQGWFFLPIGALNFGPASIGSLLFLGAGDWLGHMASKPPDPSTDNDNGV